MFVCACPGARQAFIQVCLGKSLTVPACFLCHFLLFWMLLSRMLGMHARPSLSVVLADAACLFQPQLLSLQTQHPDKSSMHILNSASCDAINQKVQSSHATVCLTCHCDKAEATHF